MVLIGGAYDHDRYESSRLLSFLIQRSLSATNLRFALLFRFVRVVLIEAGLADVMSEDRLPFQLPLSSDKKLYASSLALPCTLRLCTVLTVSVSLALFKTLLHHSSYILFLRPLFVGLLSSPSLQVPVSAAIASTYYGGGSIATGDTRTWRKHGSFGGRTRVSTARHDPPQPVITDSLFRRRGTAIGVVNGHEINTIYSLL